MKDLNPIINSAEKIMTKKFGGTVRLQGTIISQPERRNLLIRCKVLEGPNNAPDTVIIKHSVNDRGIIHDWAGYQLLSDMSSKISPEFYGGDLDANFIIIEDFENGIGLHEVLLHGDAKTAEEVLIKFAAGLGQMHAATIGEKPEFEYEKICNALNHKGRQKNQLIDNLHQVMVTIEDRINFALGKDFYDEMEKVITSLYEPGPFCAFTHGDPCLDNWLYADDSLMLIDFEFGSYQHALLDGVYGHMMFPTCWCTGGIPKRIVEQMEYSYRNELIKGCASASDDILFNKAVTEACAYWAWDTVLGRLFLCVEGNPIYENIPVWKSLIFSRLNSFIAISEKNDYLHNIRNTSYRLLELLKLLWPETAELDYYPAFRA